MGGFEHATPGIMVLMVLLIGPVLYYIRVARQGHDLYIRRIAGVDAIDEATGRSAELGRPISFSTGLTSISPALYACLGVLFYVTKKAARYNSRLVIPQNDPQVVAVVEDTLRDAYRAEGRSELYDPRSVVFLSEDQFAFAAGYMGMVQREQVATAFLFGVFAAESLMLAEAGQQIGAMQVAASLTPEQVPYFICTCDYTLIGEELYGAAAYLTREPIQLGSLYGQDRAKLVFFALIVIGVLIATYNSVGAAYGMSAIPNVTEWLRMDLTNLTEWLRGELL
jgi:hypothetical protein